MPLGLNHMAAQKPSRRMESIVQNQKILSVMFAVALLRLSRRGTEFVTTRTRVAGLPYMISLVWLTDSA